MTKKYRIEKRCVVCGSTFETILSKIKRRFCSQPCLWAWKRENPIPGGFKKGHKVPREWIEASLRVTKGIKKSPEFCAKISKVTKGEKNPFYGKKHSEENLRKMSEGRRGKVVGPANNLWRGGSTEQNFARISYPYYLWRRTVFKRDNFTCQFCFKSGCYLEPHHILRFKDYPEKRYDVSNGISLCKGCHNLTKGKEEQFEKLCHCLLKARVNSGWIKNLLSLGGGKIDCVS